MVSLLNLIWFIFGGEFLALAWLILSGICFISVIGIPLGKTFFQLAKLSACPFGKELIRETELKGKKNVSAIRKVGGIILNIIWLPIGLLFTLAYLILGALSFITVVGIPVGVVYVRMGKFLLMPIGLKVVTKKQALASAVVNEMERRQALTK